MCNITDIALQNEYSKLQPGERFQKMLSMCKTVRLIIYSQFPEDMSDYQKRRKIFEIYYRNDFSEKDFERITDMIFNRTFEQGN